MRMRGICERLNAKNMESVERFAALLADWQEKRQAGDILFHVNDAGIAFKVKPTPAIEIHK